MSSNINYASINENFPVAGEDNDTQVFRDNFDTIKNSLSAAKTEVSDLIENSANVTTDNSFNDNRITDAVLSRIKEETFNGGVITVANTELDFSNGHYQIYRFNEDSLVELRSLPENNNLGRMTLELIGNGGSVVNQGNFVVGKAYRIIDEGVNATDFELVGAAAGYQLNDVFIASGTGIFDATDLVAGKSYTITTQGSTDFTLVGAADSNPGTVFVATGPGTGSGQATQGEGTASLNQLVTFNVQGGATIYKNATFPDLRQTGVGIPTIAANSIALESSSDPIIIEVWRHSSSKVFMNYVGQFKELV